MYQRFEAQALAVLLSHYIQAAPVLEGACIRMRARAGFGPAWPGADRAEDRGRTRGSVTTPASPAPPPRAAWTHFYNLQSKAKSVYHFTSEDPLLLKKQIFSLEA